MSLWDTAALSVWLLMFLTLALVAYLWPRYNLVALAWRYIAVSCFLLSFWNTLLITSAVAVFYHSPAALCEIAFGVFSCVWIISILRFMTPEEPSDDDDGGSSSPDGPFDWPSFDKARRCWERPKTPA